MKAPIFVLLKPALPRIFLATACGLLCNVSVIGLMGFSAYLIISAGLKTPLYMLATAIVAVRACGIFRAVFRYLERYFSHTAAFRVWEKLRLYIYQKVIDAMPLSYTRLRRGDLLLLVVKALDDLRDAVLRVLLPPLTAALITIGLVWYLALFSYLAAVIMLAAFCLIFLAIPFVYKVRKKEQRISLNDEIWDFIDGAKDMLVYRYGDKCAKRALRQAAKLDQSETADFELTTAALAYGKLISVMAIMAMLVVFIELAPHLAPIDATVLLFAVMAAFEIIVPLAGLGEQFTKVKRAWHDLECLLQKHDLAYPKAAINAAYTEQTATVEALFFSYEKSRVIYEEFNLAIKNGEKVILTGASGSGKSTLVKLLLKLLPYNAGAIYQGQDPYNLLADTAVRSKIKVAMQDQYIFDLTLREHFQLLYPQIGDAEILQALDAAGLDTFVQALPQGLEAPLGRNGKFLSGGERRRFSLALALADTQAPFLVLDEPTAGLDVLTAKEIIETIRALPQDKSVLLITHDMSSVMKFDHIFVVEAGKIIEEGKPIMLLIKNGVFAQMMQRRNLI